MKLHSAGFFHRGNEIFLQREKEEERLFLYIKNTGTPRFFYKERKRVWKRQKVNIR